MKIVQIYDGKVHWITPYKTLKDVPEFSSDIIIVEAPDEVKEGWLYIDGEFEENTI